MKKKEKKLNEKQILKKLNISDFAEMTENQLKQFMYLSQFIDRTTALNIIEHLPDVTNCLGTMIDILRNTCNSVMDKAMESSKPAYDGILKVIDILDGELKNPDLTQEDRIRIESELLDCTRQLVQIDASTKQILMDQSRILYGAIGAIGIGLAALVSICLASKSSESDDIIDSDDHSCIKTDTDEDSDDYDE